MGYLDIFDRMQVDVPVGELDGIRVTKFEVIDPRKWGPEHEKRNDVVSPLGIARAARSGRAPRPGWYTRLTEKGVGLWMSDTTAERRDHAEAVMYMSSAKAERVLIHGLGIGMVVSAALSMDHIKHVDVVEKDERIVKLIGPHYLKDPRVTIHHADARDFEKLWDSGHHWDAVWTDIWADIDPDNLPEMRLFTEFFKDRSDFHGNWSESQCKRLVWDNRRWNREYLKYLTPDEQKAFANEDAEYEAWMEENGED